MANHPRSREPTKMTTTLRISPPYPVATPSRVCV